MQVRIATIPEKKLIGKCIQMTFVEDKTRMLWQSFMPRRKEIINALNKDLISMQVYDDSMNLENFTPHVPFYKWATVEVSDFDYVPADMETYILKGGMYAVFLYKGDLSGAAKAFEYIFKTWPLVPLIYWTKENTSRYLEINTKTITPIRKRNYGYL